MKPICCTMFLTVAFIASQSIAQEGAAPKTQKEKESYSLGVEVAKNFKNLGLDIDVDILVKGLKDEFSGKKLLLSENEIDKVMTAYEYGVQQKQAQTTKSAAEKNQKEGQAFLAANTKKEGVVTLPSGLQYKIIKAGEGKKPTSADTVECHYRGTLIDGTEFDSSYRRGQPATFKVSGVIPGWTEALKLMPVGSKWQLFVPAPLAYGAAGVGRDIGPNSTLIFEVELLGIK
jgi:FKBP-type peptidyl-prolyl cis-trans isomerase